MKICISSGHGLHIRGASGSPVPPQCDEVDEARRVVDEVYQLLQGAGVVVEKFHDNTSHDQSTNLATITNWHNAQGPHDLDVSVHFNAYDGNANGTEVLYVTQESRAAKVCNAIVGAGGFTNRGAKYRGDLAFLNNTREPAILIETCFCDNMGDCDRYNEHFQEVCMAIAETIGDVQVDQPPVEPPIEPPPELTGNNRVEITTEVQGHIATYVNGTLIRGDADCTDVVRYMIALKGDVTLVVNGEEFHNKPQEAPPFQANIITTVFGGDADNEYSAYGPYDSQGRGPYLNDEDYYVALPWTVDGAGRDGFARVRVTNTANGKSCVGWVGDKGPWFVDDNYPETGERPYAETLYLTGEPCPYGPNEGVVPNGAGIDISPHMAQELGISGKGVVNWEFVDEEV